MDVNGHDGHLMSADGFERTKKMEHFFNIFWEHLFTLKRPISYKVRIYFFGNILNTFGNKELYKGNSGGKKG